MPFSLSSSALNDYQRYLSLLVGNAAYVDTPPLTVDYLVIAGGGGGGSGDTAFNGGGGAGGYRSFTSQSLVTDTSYTVTVGAGGSGSTNGSNSTFNTDSATGGGRGGKTSLDNSTGGSGGGARESRTGSAGNAGSYTPVEGYAGADGDLSGNYGGGGGGASAAGSTHNGGNGSASSITGSSVTRSGGGGGGRRNSVYGSSPNGGTGGGGSGATWENVLGATSGAVNTGGGGGGGVATMAAGAGGSGLVVVKYPITYDMTVGAGLGYKTVMSGDYKITEFTSGTGTVSFALAPTVVGSGEDILQEIVLEESASSVTFSGLDAYASTYQHLQIRAVHAHTSSNGTILAQFNSDTGSNYRVHALRGTGSAVNSADYGSRTSLVLGVDVPNTTTFAAAVVDILDPFETTKYTTVRSLSGYGSGGNVNLYSGLWLNTNALASINISSASGNLNVGSRFTLIGVK